MSERGWWAPYRFPEGQQDLPPQHVAEVSRRGAVHHHPVTVKQLVDLEVSSELLCRTIKTNQGKKQL